MSNDIVTVIKDPNTFESKVITISGSVRYPGIYVIKHRKEFVTDIINRAGGITIDAYPLASTFSRNKKNVKLSFKDILKNPRSKKNFFVQNGDSITIGKKTNIVAVIGAVNAPGNYQYVRGLRLKDYIKMAGGFTAEARRSSVYITNLDGSSDKVSYLSFSPRVMDGAEITIPDKLEVEPLNITEYVTNITQIYTDLAQAYLIILLATRNN